MCTRNHFTAVPEDAIQNLQIIVLDFLFEFILEILKPRKVQVGNTADKFKALKKKKKVVNFQMEWSHDTAAL